MVPSFALQGLETAELSVRVGISGEQNQFAGFSRDQEQVLIGQEHHLPSPVTALFPSPFAVRQVETAENANVKAVGIAFMHDEIRELGFEALGLPPVGRHPRFAN